MLLAFLLQAVRLAFISILVRSLIVVDILFLLLANTHILGSTLILLPIALRPYLVLLFTRLLVAHANVHDFLSLLFRLLDFFPCLQTNTHSYSSSSTKLYASPLNCQVARNARPDNFRIDKNYFL